MLVGGWATPLKNMSSSVGMIIPNMFQTTNQTISIDMFVDRNHWVIETTDSQLGWLFPIYGKIKNVPNHQPAINPMVNPPPIPGSSGEPLLLRSKVNQRHWLFGHRVLVDEWWMSGGWMVILWWFYGISGWLMGFHGDFIRFHGDFIGFHGDFMGFHGD